MPGGVFDCRTAHLMFYLTEYYLTAYEMRCGGTVVDCRMRTGCSLQENSKLPELRVPAAHFRRGQRCRPVGDLPSQHTGAHTNDTSAHRRRGAHAAQSVH
jgi:hypothetical protein